MATKGLVLAAVVTFTLVGAHPVAAGSTVPIKGGFGTHAAFVDPPVVLPFTCPLEDGTLLGWARVMGTGNVSHLGLTTIDNLQCVWLDALGQQHLYGESDFVAANGDSLHVTYDGDVVPIDAVNIVFTGTLTIDGGTGRFAGATGTAPYSGGYSFATQVGYYDFAGRVSTVGASKR